MMARRWARQDDFDSVIQVSAQRYGVDPALIKAVIAQESGFNPSAHNPNDPGGAWGLMQVIEGTARWLGHRGPMADLFTPAVGVDLGTKYLGLQQARYRSVADTVASYNAGSPRFQADGQFINQSYVDKVLGWWAYFRAYAASKGGEAASPVAPFPARNPDSPGGLVDSAGSPEGVGPGPGPANGSQGPPDAPRAGPVMRWPVVGAVAGAGIWAVLYFATCGG